MKSNKTAFLAVVMALAFGISDAQTLPFPFPPPVTKQFEPEPLNFSLVASQTAYIDTPVSTNYYRVGTNVMTQISISSTAVIKNSKITSKDLLSILATAFNTNWPKGAQLALDHWSGDIFVVDKTGTNAVYDASVGINIGDTNIVYFRCTAGNYEVYANKLVDPNHNKNHISYKQTRYAKWFFHLFSEQNGNIYNNLNFDGLDRTDYQVDKNNIIIQSDEAPVTGDGVFTDGTLMQPLVHMIVITGQVTGSGQWYSPPAQAQPASGELKYKPSGSLILSGNTLYGTTQYGAIFGSGTVFSISLSPQLTIMRSGTNVMVTWPTNFTGFTLQSTTNVAPPVVWGTVSPAPVAVNTNNVVTNSTSGAQMFYRLSQ